MRWEMCHTDKLVRTAKSSRRPHPVAGPLQFPDTNRPTEVPHLPRPAPLRCTPVLPAVHFLRSASPPCLPIRATATLRSRLLPYRRITDKIARETGWTLFRWALGESWSLSYPEPRGLYRVVAAATSVRPGTPLTIHQAGSSFVPAA